MVAVFEQNRVEKRRMGRIDGSVKRLPYSVGEKERHGRFPEFDKLGGGVTTKRKKRQVQLIAGR